MDHNKDDALALEACPLCSDGGKPYFTKSVNGTNMAYVGCSQCGLELKAQIQFLTSREDWRLSKDIVGIWNTRSRVSAGVAPTVEELEKTVEFTAYNQAIEDAKEAIRGEKVDDPYAAAVFINAIARKCSPHRYVISRHLRSQEGNQ